ncbi:choice-of-anchor D domain-containing protein [Prosthecobacter dejongeii]|uniref:Ig-like domain-containing protein n=1 Tax=Prosthecobacter dejongeii TaxID=48465 RepID=A0A7W7YJ91_9BACT|nr:choice-of-anchor D domain-containing protein [Prosthecobacter dejongeii]MBB5037255.1 hypothetical protein [Prosthecobacter dejongeii]
MAALSSLVFLLGICLSAAHGQEAEFIALGRTSAQETIVGPLKLARSGSEAVLAASSGAEGALKSVYWSALTGWQQLPSPASITLDISSDGQRILACSASRDAAYIYNREASTLTPLPPFQLALNETFLRWTKASFYGDGKVAGTVVLRYHISGRISQSMEVTHSFRLDLATGIFERLPRRTPSGEEIEWEGSVSSETGHWVTLTRSSLGIFPPFGEAIEHAHYYLDYHGKPSGANLSPQVQWAVTAYTENNGSVYTQACRWDFTKTPAQRARLGQPLSGRGHQAMPTAVLDNGTCFGSIQMETSPAEVSSEACIWHPNGARVRLKDELTAHYHFDLPGWQFNEIHDASPDGMTLTGSGVNSDGLRESWLLQLSEPLPSRPAKPTLSAWPSGGVSQLDGQAMTFHSTQIGYETQNLIYLGNSGDAPLEILALTLTGDQAAEFSTSFATPQTLEVAKSVPLLVKFKPLSIGRKTARLTVQTNDPQTPVFEVLLIGDGPAPVLQLSEIKNEVPSPVTTLHLASILGRQIEAQLRLENSGNHPATGLSAELLESTIPGLEILTPLPTSLGIGQTSTFAIRYAPDAAGSGTASLKVTHDHPQAVPIILPIATAALSEPWQYAVTQAGSVAIPHDTALPDYGQVTLRAELTQTVTITNADSRNLDGVFARIEGTNAGDFIASLGNWTSSSHAYPLEAGASQNLTITFNPKSDGIKNARLILDAPGRWASPHVIHLTGTGVPVGDLQFVSYPAAEINTTTLNQASFRVLGEAPVSYRLYRGDYPTSSWQTVHTQGTVYLNGDHQGYGYDYSIELKSGSTTLRGPLFHRAKVKRHVASLVIVPGTGTAIPCDVDGSLGYLEYQWLKDGVEISDGDTFSNTQGQRLGVKVKGLTEKGYYQCRVTVKSPSGTASAVTDETFLDLVKVPQVIPFSFRPSRVLERPSIALRATDQNYAATTFTITGLPPGLKQTSPGSGEITGQIYHAAASKGPREYKVTVTATNAVGTGSPFETVWRIEPFDPGVAGTYHAYIERRTAHDSGRGLGGRLTVTVTRSGTFSGSLLTAGRSRGITGQIISAPPDDLPTDFPYPLPYGMTTEATPPVGISKQFLVSPGNPTVVGFGIEGNILAGLMVQYNDGQAIITGLRQIANPTSLLEEGKKARHHFVLQGNYPGYPLDFTVPGSNGFLAMTVENSGVVKWTGRLPDSTPFTGSSGVSLIRSGEESGWATTLHTPLYNRRGSVQGLLAFPGVDFTAETLLDWNKTYLPSDPTDRLYSQIALSTLTAEGSLYPLTKTLPLLNGQFDFTTKSPNGTFALAAGGMLENEVAIPMRLEKTGRIIPTVNKSGPLPKLNLSWMPTTGLFNVSGQFSTAPSAPSSRNILRPIAGQALWIPHLNKAVGPFTLPDAPNLETDPPVTPRNAPIRTGQLIFESLPTP